MPPGFRHFSAASAHLRTCTDPAGGSIDDDDVESFGVAIDYIYEAVQVGLLQDLHSDGRRAFNPSDHRSSSSTATTRAARAAQNSVELPDPYSKTVRSERSNC